MQSDLDKKYFEKKVSLLSTSDVRYVGQLYTAERPEQSIALKHVNCMGTENRRAGDQYIPPSDCTYQFIVFRAINIRELWLLDDQGRRKKDVTDEILGPLRGNQQNGSYSKNDHGGHSSKRKVGYQVKPRNQHSSGGQTGGYNDGYYQPGPYENYQGGYQAGYSNQDSYPPLPNQPNGYYGRPPQPYYEQQGGYYNQRGYNQSGYQRRAPQYYNQQRSGYYDQGYQQGYYQNNRRYPQQYNRSYYSSYYNNNNNRRYNNGGRNYNNRHYSSRSRQQQQNTGNPNQVGRAGTGAFLDNRRLRGEEIDVKDQQDFDFGAAKNEFEVQEKDKITPAVESSTDIKDKESQADVVEKTDATATVESDGDKKKVDSEEATGKEDKKSDDVDSKEPVEEKKKYDKKKSFFDNLPTQTKKGRQDIQSQKETDTATFGSVAATYKSRHTSQRGRPQNFNNRYRNNYRNQRNHGYYNQRQPPPQPSYNTGKWVARK